MCDCDQHVGRRIITADDIEAGRSDRGGWTRAQLAEWGVGWPPPKGWKDALTGAYCVHCDHNGLIHDQEFDEGGYHYEEASARLDLATERGCFMRDIPDEDVAKRIKENRGRS